MDIMDILNENASSTCTVIDEIQAFHLHCRTCLTIPV